jgi:hypothetical protein
MAFDVTSTASALASPYQQLFQRNTDLLMRFWTSPEVMGEAREATEALIRQAQTSAMKLFESSAFTDLSRELLSSYSEFFAQATRAQVDGAMAMQQQTLEQGKAAAAAGTTALRRAA